MFLTFYCLQNLRSFLNRNLYIKEYLLSSNLVATVLVKCGLKCCLKHFQFLFGKKQYLIVNAKNAFKFQRKELNC